MKKLVTFITAGYPDEAKCLKYMKAMAEGGADVIELGIPFSDPLADGPVIQETSQIALDRGMNVKKALRLAKQFTTWRKKRLVRLVFMTYLNPVLAYGLPLFMSQARKAGVDGVIPVDLIPEESEGFAQAAEAQGLVVTFLCSPTCTDTRMRRIADATTGFIYLVSVKGVTGARKSLSNGVEPTMERLRAVTDKPVYVGFGISNPKQAASIAKLCDGVVVGSALLKQIPPKGRDRSAQVKKFVASLRRALDKA